MLSGGGSSGLAHIGVLKALEENNIPIDYITGTSSGALIGSLYSLGFTPQQLEKLVQTEQFRDWAYGNINQQYIYYFKRKEENASWISFKLSLDTSFITNLPTNLINPVAIDFALMEITASAIAAAGYNFDSLMIPFRCVASDIESKQTVVFRRGDLGQAIRASMSYPFYLRPIVVDGKLLFDGGLYNNFPSNVMYQDFYPDIIIGSNVASANAVPHEENVLSQIRTMMTGKTNFLTECESGIMIQPVVNVGVFDFDESKFIIDSGYNAAMRTMPEIKKYITRELDSLTLSQKRTRFNSKKKNLQFENISIEGLNSKQSSYIRKTIKRKGRTLTVNDLRRQYFLLAQDDKIKQIYPLSKYNPSTGNFDLLLNIKKEKDLTTQFGGNFSNRPINMGFIAAEYNYFSRFGLNLHGNVYFGKLYSSALLGARLDFPFDVPFYVEPKVVFNRWDFFKSSNSFFEDIKPAYLIQRDQYAEMNVAMPVDVKGKLLAGGGIASSQFDYYQTAQFSSSDTSDRTNFDFVYSHLTYDRNSLNRKMYASSGSYFSFKVKYIQGEEHSIPGSTSLDRSPFRRIHEWVQFKATYDNYYKSRGKLRMGFFAEGVFSSQTLFNNYSSSILSSPSFQPTPESRTLFLSDFRAHKYVATGIKNIWSIRKNLDIRVEGFLFLPVQAILSDLQNKAVYGGNFATKNFIGTGGIVFHSPVGPISTSVNYYRTNIDKFSFLFHFGYILFNRRAVE